jgi:tetraacyldisaccharide 4'-kinase
MLADVRIEWPRGKRGERVLRVTTEGASGALSALLLPAEALYATAMAARNLAYDARLLPIHRVSMPVISIGNIVAGGAGKTPVTRWLAEQLLTRGRTPAILHGGYGDDEPRLHQQWHPEIPVVSNRDRIAGANQAIAQGADVILLDDGFQHRRLARDLDIVLISADDTAAHLLPRGPGREPLHALRRSSFVLVTRKSAATELAMVLETKVHQAVPGVPTARAHLRIVSELPVEPVAVVTAVARPDLLLAQLMQAGAHVLTFLAYPDHYDYTTEDAADIVARAGNHLLLTTAKDAVKLRELLPTQSMLVLEQQVAFESGAGDLMTAVDNIL